MKTFLHLAFLSLVAVYSGPALADLDPVLQKCYPPAELNARAQSEIQKLIDHNFRFDGDTVNFTNDQTKNLDYVKGVKGSLHEECIDLLRNYFQQNRQDIQMQFDVKLDLSKISTDDVKSLSVDIRQYKNGQTMTVFFKVRPISCNVDCGDREVVYGGQTVVADQVCRVKVAVNRIGDFSSDTQP